MRYVLYLSLPADITGLIGLSIMSGILVRIPWWLWKRNLKGVATYLRPGCSWHAVG